jgi:peptide/nickel transport system permease protein
LYSRIITFLGVVLSLILIGALPQLFNDISFAPHQYADTLTAIFSSITNPSSIMYKNPTSGAERAIFPYIFRPYFYSLTIFFGSLATAFFLSLTCSLFYFLSKERFQKLMNRVAFILGALPDIFIIVFVQLSIIFLYKKTNILFLNIASVGDDYIFTLPILCLSILPGILFFKLFVLLINEEYSKLYVEFAISKGLKKYYLLCGHILRNTMISLYYHGKSIIWFMLSNLLILEYLFNIFGITSFLFTYHSPILFVVVSILLFIPMYGFLVLIGLGINKLVRIEVEI